MALPTPRETIPRLLSQGVITPDDAQRYLQNYDFFEQNRTHIEASYPRKWVASLNGSLYTGNRLEELRANLIELPYANRAYVEHVGVWS